MNQNNIVGDISGVNECQFHFINKVLDARGFIDCNVNFEAVGKAGDNYIATMKRITVQGDNGTLTAIAKIAPDIELLRQYLNTATAFRNEHVFYTEVLPKFLQLQTDADVPKEEIFRFAECYGSFSEEPNETILLEDLSISNFRMLDRFESLSDACVKSVLKNFAVLHSLSYVLKKVEPQTFDCLRSSLIDIWSHEPEVDMMKNFCEQIEGDILLVLEEEEHKNLVRHKITDTINVFAKLSKMDAGSKYSVIQQGDAWTNNIMFKIKEDSKPESILIDYQQSRESNPVCDLLYMILNCTDHDTRKKHYNDWIDYYHAELDRSLSHFGLKATLMYPRAQLDADLKRYGNVFFFLSLVLSVIIILKSEDAAKIIDAVRETTQMDQISIKLSDLDEETISRFKKRFYDLVASFKEFGLM